jgi:hypothetical protein
VAGFEYDQFGVQIRLARAPGLGSAGDWLALPPADQAAARVLGWDATIWDAGFGPPAAGAAWSALTEAQAAAARQLGYCDQLWGGHQSTRDLRL